MDSKISADCWSVMNNIRGITSEQKKRPIKVLDIVSAGYYFGSYVADQLDHDYRKNFSFSFSCWSIAQSWKMLGSTESLSKFNDWFFDRLNNF